MIDLSLQSGTGPFRAIYLEERARHYPVAESLLRRFGDCPVIPVRRYRDVFARPKQDFRFQENRPALILAIKEPPFLYEGPDVCQNFGADRFFYTGFVQNCLFRCSYCFLRGMYPSSYLTAFVNTDDFLRAIRDISESAADEKVLIAASYDTDLLAFDPFYSYADLLIESLKDCDNVTIELRTKSADTRFYSRHKGDPGPVIAAFSIAPDDVIRAYERKTPPLIERLNAARQAVEAGFPLRLCLDPIFPEERFLPQYDEFFALLFSVIAPEQIRDMSYGFFRMSQTFYRRISGKNPLESLYLLPLEEEDGVVSYPAQIRREVMNRHLAVLSSYFPRERIDCL